MLEVLELLKLLLFKKEEVTIETLSQKRPNFGGKKKPNTKTNEFCFIVIQVKMLNKQGSGFYGVFIIPNYSKNVMNNL